MSISLASIIIDILCFVPAIVFHEMAHGYAAYKLGDPTAKRAGRLSMNPLRHIDLFGTIIMPLLLMVLNAPIFGYAKPVPYNPNYFKNPRSGELIVGLSGPAANLAMSVAAALIALILYLIAPAALISAYFEGGGFVYYAYWQFLPMFSLINLYLLFFNLIPVPPLDGSSIIGFFLPQKWLPAYYKVQRYALPIFFIVVILLPFILSFNPIGIYLDVTAGNVFNLMYSFI